MMPVFRTEVPKTLDIVEHQDSSVSALTMIDLAETKTKDDNTLPVSSPSSETSTYKEQQLRSRFTKPVAGIVFAAFVLFVILDSTIGMGWIADGVDTFLEWIEENPVGGFFAFIIVYFVATVIFIPGSILTLGAGFVFANAFGLGVGVLLSTLAVFFGASSGAIVSFLVGRYLLRDWVQRLTKKYAVFEALDKALESNGLKIMVLLRLSPILPFNALNYISSVTAVGFWEYTWALLAILPGTVLYTFLGASAGSLSDSASSGDSVIFVVVAVGVVFGVAAIALTSYYAKKELKKLTTENDETGQGDELHRNESMEVEEPKVETLEV